MNSNYFHIVMISVITAAYNSENDLPGLIQSLRNQSDKDFEWVIADGASTDKTLKILRDISDINIIITSCPDFGVYDGLNRAIKKANGLYYLVCGSDDILDVNAISNFKKAIIDTNADILVAKYTDIHCDVCGVKKYRWLHGTSAIMSSHSVGMVFRRSLHDKYGYYSNMYPICADKLFIENVIRAESVIAHCDFIAGQFSGTGISSKLVVNTLCENFCINILFGENKFIQLILLFMRLLKNISKI